MTIQTDTTDAPRPALLAATELVADGATLPIPLAEAAMEEVMDGEAPPEQLAALLAMLHLRGETAEEVSAFARVMRGRAIRVEAPDDALDLCGTGADRSGSFNISTIAALVVAGAGVPVAKHGNRAMTSRAGSADLVEALGIPLDPGVEVVQRSIREACFGFLFAPAFHPATRHAAPTRRLLPFGTIFNVLGPLTNPARVRRQLLGVGDPRLVPLLAGALMRLGVDRAVVTHGADGLDELGLAGPNQALLVEGGAISPLVIDGADAGLRRAPASAFTGGDAQLNSAIALSILGGEPGPGRDVVLLNAGAGLFVAGRARDVAEGVGVAAESIDSGAAAGIIGAVTAVCS